MEARLGLLKFRAPRSLGEGEIGEGEIGDWPPRIAGEGDLVGDLVGEVGLRV